jgi:iron-sulfur cluster repair protein YtfE (RIC family)
MQTITSVLTDDHRYADDLFAAATREATQGAWEGSARQLALFRAALETHMKIEEDVLFPAFEQATGNTRGPTAVMRSEHVQMLAQLDDISRAIASRDAATFQSLTQSFTDVLNLHSTKEEQILYPMCDRVVDTLDGDGLRQKLDELRAER